MKKLLIFLFMLGLLSCGSSKAVKTSYKVIKGNWVLNDIKSSVIGELNITLLNSASKACFEGSTWEFIPNNNTGSYTLTGSGCQLEKNYFVFTIDEIDEATGLYDILLKPTNKKGKSPTKTGFRLELTALTETTMQMQQNLNFEGRPMTLTMNFTKL